jgi:hypothetical protein
MRSRLTLSVVAVALAWASHVHAQFTIPGAGYDKFGLIAGDRSVTVSTTDAGVALFWTTARYRTQGDCDGFPPKSAELFDCLATLTSSPWTYEFSIGLAGEKSKSSIASKGLFTPGVSSSAGVKYRWERPNTTGYYDFYGGFSFVTNPLYVASFPTSGAETDAWIDRDLEKRIGGAGGVNRFFNEHFGLGGAVTLTRALSTPGERKPISLCTMKASSPDIDGQLVEASECHNGFVAPLADQWVNTFRLDALYNFNRYGLGQQGRPVPVATFGVIGSVQVSRRTETPTVANISFGPVLHPNGVPHRALLALVIKVADVTNALDDRSLSQRFSAALWFGIPLTGF